MKKVIAFLALLFLISCNNAIVDHLEQNPDTSYVPSSELTEKQAQIQSCRRNIENRHFHSIALQRTHQRCYEDA